MVNKYSNFSVPPRSFVTEGDNRQAQTTRFSFHRWRGDAREKGERETFDERTIKFLINFRHYPIFRNSRQRERKLHFIALPFFMHRVDLDSVAMQFMCIVFRFISSFSSWSRDASIDPNHVRNEDIDHRDLIFTFKALFVLVRNYENLNIFPELIRLFIQSSDSPQFSLQA